MPEAQEFVTESAHGLIDIIAALTNEANPPEKMTALDSLLIYIEDIGMVLNENIYKPETKKLVLKQLQDLVAITDTLRFNKNEQVISGEVVQISQKGKDLIINDASEKINQIHNSQ